MSAPLARIRLLCVAAAVAAGVATPGAASTAAEHEPAAVKSAAAGAVAANGRRISFEGTFLPAALLPPACDAAGRCAYPLARTGSEYTGAFEGTSIGAGAGTPITGGFVGTAVHVFTGAIRNCGAGTLVWTETLRSSDGINSTGTWRVTAGAGTGDLADVVGGGTFRAVQAPDGSGTASIIGRIRC
jgi:hypothetical protein